MLETVFMGTPELAVPALRVLAARTDLRLVVTQPDRPAGRGKKLRAPPVKQAAHDLGLPVWQPGSLREAAGDPRLHDLDLVVVMAYGEILRQRVLDLPRRGCINLHCSLLPRWRGASPMQAALRAGDRQTGISVQHVVRRLDAGPVYLREVLPLPSDASLPWLHDCMAELGAVALERFLDRYQELEAVPQDEGRVTVCRKLTSADGHIDWAQGAVEVERQVRAYTPAPGCWTLTGDQRLRILGVELRADHHLEAGRVRQYGRELHVGCGHGSVAVTRLQPPGGRPMTVDAYINGHAIPLAFG